MTQTAFENEVYYPTPSGVVTQAFCDHLSAECLVRVDGIYGYSHWMRVLYNGRLIGRAVGANIKVIELFSLLHDTMRRTEGNDPEHGMRAAEYALDIRNKWIEATDDEMWLLIDALRNHSRDRLSDDVTVQACWDADRLDSGRHGLAPRANQLGLPYSKRLDVIAAAHMRSQQGVPAQ